MGAIGATYNLTMDPYEKYDMTFNGAAPTRTLSSSPGKYAGQDNGWVLSMIEPAILEFDKSIMKYPSIKRFPGGASNDETFHFPMKARLLISDRNRADLDWPTFSPPQWPGFAPPLTP